MQRRNLAPVGAPNWIELITSDSTTTQASYTAMFGWEYENGGNELGGNITCLSDGAQIAGITPTPTKVQPAQTNS